MFNAVLAIEIAAAICLGVFLTGCVFIDAAQDRRYARRLRRRLMREWKASVGEKVRE